MTPEQKELAASILPRSAPLLITWRIALGFSAVLFIRNLIALILIIVAASGVLAPLSFIPGWKQVAVAIGPVSFLAWPFAIVYNVKKTLEDGAWGYQFSARKIHDV